MHVLYSLYVLSAILVPLMDVINKWHLIGLICATPTVVGWSGGFGPPGVGRAWYPHLKVEAGPSVDGHFWMASPEGLRLLDDF